MMNLRLKRFSLGRRALFGGFVALGMGAAGVATGCGEREESWSASLSLPDPIQLTGAVALRDAALDRILFVTSSDKDKLETSSESVGLDVVSVQASPDGQRLFVLSKGVTPRLEKDDEPPQLLVFDGGAQKGTDSRLIKKFTLDDPMKRLAIDPKGEWVTAYDGDATVTNANELVLLSLSGDDEEGTVETRTIRSFGGSPLGMVFTDELLVPEGGARRFLVVYTDRDVALVDLKNPERPEVTVKLPKDAEGVAYVPQEVVFDDGDPDDPTDARLAIRMAESSDVVLLELGESSDKDLDFSVVMNIVAVGAPPTAIDFVRTDGGLRLAALVPTRLEAALVDPETTLSEVVALPSAFSSMRRITGLVDETPTGGDVALLWGSSQSVAFWSLGTSSMTPYRSVETTELSFVVDEVLDVPSPNQHLKVLQGSSGSSLFVLDLKSRQSSPLATKLFNPSLTVSSDGERVWVYGSTAESFSSVTLSDLHPNDLNVRPAVNYVADIEQKKGGRAAIIFHFEQGWQATLMDAQKPDSAETTFFPALHLEGLL